jgi:hypothetical protein
MHVRSIAVETQHLIGKIFIENLLCGIPQSRWAACTRSRALKRSSRSRIVMKRSEYGGSPLRAPLTDQLHTSTLRPGTFEKCLRLFVTTIIPWETACEAMRRSIFPIGLPERSNSERIRA